MENCCECRKELSSAEIKSCELVGTNGLYCYNHLQKFIPDNSKNRSSSRVYRTEHKKLSE